VEIRQRLIDAFANLISSVVNAVPTLIVGILLVAGAFLLATLAERSLRFILTKVRFDQLVGKAGIDQAFQRLGIRQDLTWVIPRLVYFLVLLLLAQTAVEALGLEAIGNAINAFFSYLPNIVAAMLLLLLGSTVGQFAGRTVTSSAESAGLDFAPALGRLVSSGILFVCAMMAIAQLKIDTEIIRIVTSLVLGGAALAFGLSFGLGTRDIIRNIAAGFYARKLVAIGRPLEIKGERGVLVAVTATHTILEFEGKETLLPNSEFLNEVAKQS
jgi:small-conductance mechanosensitive channel